jgi:hypothetical protein
LQTACGLPDLEQGWQRRDPAARPAANFGQIAGGDTVGTMRNQTTPISCTAMPVARATDAHYFSFAAEVFNALPLRNVTKSLRAITAGVNTDIAF